MILTLFDNTQAVGASKSKGSAVPLGMLAAKDGPSFKSAIAALVNQAESGVGDTAAIPLDRLFARLSKALQSLESLSQSQDPNQQIDSVIAQISSVLVDFEEATGVDLLEAIQPFFSALTDAVPNGENSQLEGDVPTAATAPVLTENAALVAETAVPVIDGETQTIDVIVPVTEGETEAVAGEALVTDGGEALTIGDAPGVDIPGLVAFVNLVRKIGQLIERSEGFKDVPKPAVPKSPGLEGIVNAQANLKPQVGPPQQIRESIPEQAKAVGQPAAATLAGLALRFEERVVTTQAIKQGKATAGLTATGEAASPDTIDVQIAMAAAQKGTEKNWVGSERFKNAFEFVSNIANGQQVQQTPTVGIVSVLEPIFADFLPQDRQPLISPTQLDMPAPTSASDAGSTKPSRFAAIIVDQIRAANVSDGQTKVELSPRGLGNIEIEVTTDADGATNVVIRADNNVVLNALREMRDPWTQIPGMENGSSFSFEDMSRDQGGTDSDGAGTMTDDTGAAVLEAGQAIDPVSSAIIDNGQLDLMT